MKTQTVYKALAKRQKKLFSLNKVVGNNPFCQRYHTEKENFPKIEGTSLMAFNNLNDAVSFASGWKDTTVYKCDAVLSQRQKVPTLVCVSAGFTCRSLTKEAITDFWRTFNPRLTQALGCRCVPQATVFCDSLTLTEKVW